MRGKLALASLIVCSCAAAALWFGLEASHHAKFCSRRYAPLSLAGPLPRGQKTTLADAEAKLGASIVLPNTPGMAASDVGAVWVRQDGGLGTGVAITLPRAGLILQLGRPYGYNQPPAQMYRTFAAQEPDLYSVIDLDGVPAMAVRQNADQTCQNFGAIEFAVRGTRIAVLGHYDEATLRTYASSLLAAASG